jgi:uncharacterized protein (DUF2147 family)
MREKSGRSRVVRESATHRLGRKGMEATQNGVRAVRRLTLVAVLAALLLPATASAADSIYWGNEFNAVRVGNLDGTGAQDVVAGKPCGVAIDAAAGKIYWANWDQGKIQRADLDVTDADNDGPDVQTLFDAPDNHLCGVAVDPANNKIYWANFSSDEIRVGNLQGTSTSTLFRDPAGSAPSGVAIDPAAGKIYWTNQFTDQVRVGNLDGSGTASTLFGRDAAVPTVERNPIGVAINPAAGKIYWTDLGSCCSGPGQVRVGNLDGTGASTLFGDELSPGGLAIDPGANKIYWATFGGGAIRSGNLNGTGTASSLFSSESNPLFPALLRKPLSTEPPEVLGGAKTGKAHVCSQGSWAPDLLGAFLFQAPASFAYQWEMDGAKIATGATFTPTVAGNYTCTVRATNQAGETSRTSAVKKIKVK